MRRVTLGTTGIETSCLGFGCASLGSPRRRGAGAPGARRRLRRRRHLVRPRAALRRRPGGGDRRALPQGPPRDSGADLQQGRAGARAAAARGLKAALMPAARAAVQAVPALRGAPAPLAAPRRRKALPLTPGARSPAPLETSLRRLGTDHLDLYALHGVAASALTEPVLRALEDVRAAGKARAVAVASDAGGRARRHRAIGAPFGAVQAALPAPGAPDALLPAARGRGLRRHRALGLRHRRQPSRRSRRAPPPTRPSARRSTGRRGPRPRCRGLLERAFALNPDGVVLVSMFCPEPRREPPRRAVDPAATTLEAPPGFYGLDRRAVGRTGGQQKHARTARLPRQRRAALRAPASPSGEGRLRRARCPPPTPSGQEASGG